jgi:hypothetical protein
MGIECDRIQVFLDVKGNSKAGAALRFCPRAELPKTFLSPREQGGITTMNKFLGCRTKKDRTRSQMACFVQSKGLRGSPGILFDERGLGARNGSEARFQ